MTEQQTHITDSSHRHVLDDIEKIATFITAVVAIVALCFSISSLNHTRDTAKNGRKADYLEQNLSNLASNVTNLEMMWRKYQTNQTLSEDDIQTISRIYNSSELLIDDRLDGDIDDNLTDTMNGLCVYLLNTVNDESLVASNNEKSTIDNATNAATGSTIPDSGDVPELEEYFREYAEAEQEKISTLLD